MYLFWLRIADMYYCIIYIVQCMYNCTVLSIVSTPTIFPDCSASHHVSGSINNGGLSLRGFSPTVQCTRSASFPQLRDLSSFFSVKRTEFLYNYCEQEQDFIHLL